MKRTWSAGPERVGMRERITKSNSLAEKTMRTQMPGESEGLAVQIFGGKHYWKTEFSSNKM